MTAAITVAGHVLPISDADVARFIAKIDKGGPDGCWIWTAAMSSTGYGSFRMPGRTVNAHRFAWALAGKELDPALQLDHLCHRPACVNPDHLLQVTQSENMANRAGATSHNMSSGVRGVSWDRQYSRWEAYAMLHGRKHHAGRHASVEAAELAALNLRLSLGMANAADLARLAELDCLAICTTDLQGAR